VLVALDKSVAPVVSVRVSRPVSPPRLFRDPSGQVVYTCGAGAYSIDVAGKKAAPYEWIARGHEFDFSHRCDPTYGHIVRHRGEEIGRWWCLPGKSATAAGF